MPLPAYVRLNDGRLEPFDPDRLYRRLFAAAEEAGHADPLAARELTDLVLHFLRRSTVGLIVELDELRDRARTVLRELRHAPVALALAGGGRDHEEPVAWGFDATAPLTNEEIERPNYRRYGRALGLAEELGLLELDTGGAPDGLAALTVRLPAPGTGGLEFIEQHRPAVAGTLALDAPDLDAHFGGWTPTEVRVFFAEVAWAAALHGLTVELHLGSRRDPSWSEAAPGPLFRAHQHADDLAHRESLRQTLLDAALGCSGRLWSGLKLVWHLDPAPAGAPMALLLRLCRAARAGQPVEFVVDGAEVPLAVGTTRRQPALLQTVTLDLMTLWVRQRRPLEPGRFLGKAQSLARLAAGAGSRKRERLRHALPADSAWRLEASHAALRIDGLEELASEVPTFARPSFAHRLARRLRATLREEATLRSLPFVTLQESEMASGAFDGSIVRRRQDEDAADAAEWLLRSAGRLAGARVCLG